MRSVLCEVAIFSLRFLVLVSNIANRWSCCVSTVRMLKLTYKSKPKITHIYPSFCLTLKREKKFCILNFEENFEHYYCLKKCSSIYR